MAAASASCLSLLVVLAALASAASAQLSSTFYDRSCPNALSTIRSGVNAAVRQEPRVGASLLRLHFHDCFVRASLDHMHPCLLTTTLTLVFFLLLLSC
jgi:peroxidase